MKLVRVRIAMMIMGIVIKNLDIMKRQFIKKQCQCFICNSNTKIYQTENYVVNGRVQTKYKCPQLIHITTL